MALQCCSTLDLGQRPFLAAGSPCWYSPGSLPDTTEWDRPGCCVLNLAWHRLPEVGAQSQQFPFPPRDRVHFCQKQDETPCPRDCLTAGTPLAHLLEGRQSAAERPCCHRTRSSLEAL